MEITVDQLTFTAVSAGPEDGPPVLLLHGFPEGARCWEQVLVLLADAGLRCVAPDQRGYSVGARPAGVAAYTLDLLVADAVSMLDALGWRHAHVVGHDWGAMVAWVLAARHPERVRTLTAVAVPHPAAFGAALRSDPDQQQKSAYIRLFREPAPRPEDVLLADDGARLRTMFTGSTLDPDEVGRYVAPLQQPGALTAALNWYRAMVAEDYAAVPVVRVPTTYVWGDTDLAVGRVAASGCAAYVTGDYRFAELPETTHWVPEQAPDLLAALILERVTPADPAEGG
jgi:pimeloyl-ACP methyl ester carboxylesterase